MHRALQSPPSTVSSSPPHTSPHHRPPADPPGSSSWLTRLVADERKRCLLGAAVLAVVLAVFALYYVSSFERKQPLDDFDDFHRKYPVWHSEVGDMGDEEAADIFRSHSMAWNSSASGKVTLEDQDPGKGDVPVSSWDGTDWKTSRSDDSSPELDGSKGGTARRLLSQRVL